MRILHVITGLHKAAGTSVFCGEIANELVSLGHDVAIAVIDPSDADVYPLNSRIRLVSMQTILHSSISTLNFDLVHIHALWTPILTKVAKWAHAQQIPVVWSPHGMLTPWAMKNKRLKKLLGWWLYQRSSIRAADFLHVTAESEVEDVRRMGLGNSIVVAPLGVRLPKEKVDFRCSPLPRTRTILFLSRVQKKKGLITLMDAWARVDRTGWRIVIAGPSQEGHIEEVLARAQENGVEDSVEYVGPVFGEAKDKLYADSDLFVLPTFSENFGSVVIEALAAGVPVITTKGAPWHELEESRCGLWIDIGEDPLVAALQEMTALSDVEREEMGSRGRKLVEEKYTWKAVCDMMVTSYKEVLNGKA